MFTLSAYPEEIYPGDWILYQPKRQEAHPRVGQIISTYHSYSQLRVRRYYREIDLNVGLTGRVDPRELFQQGPETVELSDVVGRCYVMHSDDYLKGCPPPSVYVPEMELFHSHRGVNGQKEVVNKTEKAWKNLFVPRPLTLAPKLDAATELVELQKWVLATFLPARDVKVSTGKVLSLYAISLPVPHRPAQNVIRFVLSVLRTHYGLQRFPFDVQGQFIDGVQIVDGKNFQPPFSVQQLVQTWIVFNFRVTKDPKLNWPQTCVAYNNFTTRAKHTSPLPNVSQFAQIFTSTLPACIVQREEAPPLFCVEAITDHSKIPDPYLYLWFETHYQRSTSEGREVNGSDIFHHYTVFHLDSPRLSESNFERTLHIFRKLNGCEILSNEGVEVRVGLGPTGLCLRD